MAEDAAAVLEGAPTPAADRREDDRSSADRDDAGRSGESIPRTDHDWPQTADEPQVPEDAGDDRSTGPDAVPAGPGATAPPAADRSAPGPTAAASGSTGTGDNPGMDRDAGEPSEDQPTREHPRDHGAGGDR
jgi:hypothetical protein